ncbi:hypothetical protein SAMN05444414_108142 [Roseovarius marisflavi]|uniref:Uncharacterized protein n=1 Tax=Roseovarius marisflavi TaxID=1054996 RepID=A0A1M6Z2Q5_9RHOB|nr:hypothetical protein SAMN05444414_108142 [Roseovarius marisflavi]
MHLQTKHYMHFFFLTKTVCSRPLFAIADARCFLCNDRAAAQTCRSLKLRLMSGYTSAKALI